MELTYCSGMAHSFGRRSDRWRPLLTFIHNPAHSSRSSLATPFSRMTDPSDISHSTFDSAPHTAVPFSPALSFTFSTSQSERPCTQQHEHPHTQPVSDGRGYSHYDQGHSGWYQSDDGHYHAYYYDEDGTSYYPYYNYGDDGLRTGAPAAVPAPIDVVPSSPVGAGERGISPPPSKRHRTSVPLDSSTPAIVRRSSSRHRSQLSEHDTSVVPFSRTPSLSPSPCPSPPHQSATSTSSISLKQRSKRTTKTCNEAPGVTPSPTPSSSSSSSSSDHPRTGANAEAYDPAEPTSSSDASQANDRRRRQPGPPQMHICPMPGCDKQFVRRFNLKVHIITHDPERAHQFECIEGCGRRYTRKNDMERHVKSVHLGERLKCQTCGFRFTRVDGLRKHNCNSPMSSPYVADSGHTPRPLALKPSSSSSSSVSSISVSTTTSSSSSSSVVMAAQALASRLSLSNTRGTAEARSSAAPHQDSPAARPPNNVDPKLEEPAKATDSGRPRFLLPAPSGSATTAGSQSSFNAVSTANAGGGSHPGEEPIHENSFAVRRSEPAEIKQTLCAKEETPTDEKPVWRLVRDTSNL